MPSIASISQYTYSIPAAQTNIKTGNEASKSLDKEEQEGQGDKGEDKNDEETDRDREASGEAETTECSVKCKI